MSTSISVVLSTTLLVSTTASDLNTVRLRNQWGRPVASSQTVQRGKHRVQIHRYIQVSASMNELKEFPAYRQFRMLLFCMFHRILMVSPKKFFFSKFIWTYTFLYSHVFGCFIFVTRIKFCLYRPYKWLAYIPSHCEKM